MALTQLKTGAIADDAVTTDKLANAINTERTANTAKSTNATHTGEVTGSGELTITADAVTGAKIADAAIDSEHYTDGSIDTAHIAADAVTSAKIADGAVDTAQLAGTAITTDKLGAAQVTTAKIADSAVTAAKLAAGVGGKIVQVVSITKKGAVTNSTAAASWWEYNNSTLRADITASSASNKFLVLASISCTGNSVGVFIKLMDDGVDIVDAKGDAAGNRTRSTSSNDHSDTHSHTTTPIMVLLDAGDTNQHRFHVAFAHTSGSLQTMCLNRSQNDGDGQDRNRNISTITVLEIAA